MLSDDEIIDNWAKSQAEIERLKAENEKLRAEVVNWRYRYEVMRRLYHDAEGLPQSEWSAEAKATARFFHQERGGQIGRMLPRMLPRC